MMTASQMFLANYHSFKFIFFFLSLLSVIIFTYIVHIFIVLDYKIPSKSKRDR